MPSISVKLDFDYNNTARHRPNDPDFQNISIDINGFLSKSELNTLRIFIADANSGMEPDVNLVSNVRIPRLALDTTENAAEEVKARKNSIELVISEDSLFFFGVVSFNLTEHSSSTRIILNEALNETMKVINIMEKLGYSVVCQSSNVNSKYGYPHSYWIWTLNKKN